MDKEAAPLGWWSISGEALLDMMRRAHEGEDPSMVYAEEYANSDREYPTDAAQDDDLRALLADVRSFLADVSTDYTREWSAFTRILFDRFDQRIEDALA